jgi:hypothetical protein
MEPKPEGEAMKKNDGKSEVKKLAVRRETLCHLEDEKLTFAGAGPLTGTIRCCTASVSCP